MEYTTIKINKAQRDFLDEIKVHPRQSYEEVLELLITHCKEAIKKGDLEIYKK